MSEERRKELLYEMITGQSIYGTVDFVDEKLEVLPETEFLKEYEKLYEEIYLAKNLVEQTLGEEENPYIEKMLDNFLKLNELIGYKMYDIAKSIYSNKEHK